MSKYLDRVGEFHARPISWGLQRKEGSKSVAMAVEFLILGEVDGRDVVSWEGSEDHTINGYFYIVKRDGTVNQHAVDSLVDALGWDGNLGALAHWQPFDVCRITTEYEEYNGKDYLKVKWLNNVNFAPGPKTAESQEVQALDQQYGSLMRAAAADTRRRNGEPPAPKAETAPPPAGGTATATENDDDPPFNRPAAGASGAPTSPQADAPPAAGQTGGLPGADKAQEGGDGAPVSAADSAPGASIPPELAAMGFVPAGLDAMTFDELRDHANRLRKAMDLGEQSTVRAAVEHQDIAGLVAVLRRVCERRGGEL